jgi:iron complex outermembrane receptor protein
MLWNNRLWLVNLILLSWVSLFRSPLLAQDESSQAEPAERISVVGTRVSTRTVDDSTAPVDLILVEDLRNQASSDLNNLLRQAVPSFNINTQPISDAATIVRPPNLRGLPPDSTLVLVNGKRRHRAAVISFLGFGVADGAQGPDISVIPTIALDRVEVLRDGASAQYGSDAIAGVINFVLKDSGEGGIVELKGGQTYQGDGALWQGAAHLGLMSTDHGFANLSLAARKVEPTDRSVQRADAQALREAGNLAVPDPAQKWGQPEVDDDIKLFLNAAQQIRPELELYAFGNYAQRHTEGGFYYRNPNSRAGVFVRGDDGSRRLVGDLNPDNALECPEVAVGDEAALAAVLDDNTDIGRECFVFNELFPGGFTPRFGGTLKDYSVVGGIRGEFDSGLRYDLSTSFGHNRVDFYLKNTVNASLGPATPTEFDAGAYLQEERQMHFDLVYPLYVSGPISELNLAAGLEWREEAFEILTGEPASYAQGPLTTQNFSVGANGFAGFSPDVAGRHSRENVAGYIDVEANLRGHLLLGLATRVEDYEDFGSTANGKLSLRWNINPLVAVRGTASSGFRAPTPGQSNVTNITTIFENGELVNRGTIPPTNPIARLKGGQQLEPEKSVNYSFGTVLTTGPLKLTLDYFQILVRDRIAQSSTQELTQEEAQQLEEDGIAGASGLQSFRFYTNGFKTKTQGLDLVVGLPWSMWGGQSLLSFAGNWTDTQVVGYQQGVLDNERIRQIEEGLPQYRANLSWFHRIGGVSTIVRLNYFGEYFEVHLDDPNQPLEGGDEYTVDVEGAFQVLPGLTWAIGAENLFDEYPDLNPYRDVAGAKYAESAPMGFRGGFYYSRLAYKF